MTNYCPLCGNIGDVLFKHHKRLYFQCNNCFGIFIDPKHILSNKAEMHRYKQHNNDVENEKYQQFVLPITSSILKDYKAKHTGLDFGAGTGPVISKILDDNNYQIVQYDPYFHNYPKLLEAKYDYVVCCEVMEHFSNPQKEFLTLVNLLKPLGRLYCMTNLYDENTNWDNWHYMDDPTHIFIYHKETIQWIKEEFGFSDVKIESRLITYLR